MEVLGISNGVEAIGAAFASKLTRFHDLALEMCRQQTVFDRNVVSCHVAAIGAKQHPSRRRLAQATTKKTNPPRSACHRAIRARDRAAAHEGIANNEGSYCQ